MKNVQNVIQAKEEECIVINEIMDINNINDFDTFERPNNFEENSYEPKSDIPPDEDLMEDVKRERKVMDDVLGYLNAKNHPLRYWSYGHFHQSWHCEKDGVRYNMLDCLELREIKT